jgi:hypothetical protein
LDAFLLLNISTTGREAEERQRERRMSGNDIHFSADPLNFKRKPVII